MSPDSSRKKLLVFVHGFGSSRKCWEPLLALLEKNPAFMEQFHLVCFEYETRVVNFRFLRRIPRLEELANQLDAFLEAPEFRSYGHVTLVGHSQGGLVIQAYVKARLESSDRARLERIRQLIFIATPHLGSIIVSRVREFVFSFFTNPQERILRAYNPHITDLVTRINANVYRATGDGEGCWRIPIHCFAGDSDRVVTEASARGPFGTWTSLPGDHFTVLRPKDMDDPRYLQFVDAVVDPSGHPTLWEIEKFEVQLRVEPLTGPNRKHVVEHGKHRRKVDADNFARMTRRVQFSSKNKCTDSFALLRYNTESQGFVRFQVEGGDNAWLPEERDAYDAHGRNAVFRLVPQAGAKYALHAEILGGYTRVAGQDNLHAHFHLGRRLARYRKVVLELDLCRYLEANPEFALAPELHFHPQDTSHSQVCHQRRAEDRVACVHSDPKGIWRWEIDNISGGIIDIAWDVQKVPVTQVYSGGPKL